MNFNKSINSNYLKNNPLCGIDTYKDELNLATGACKRQVKKLVLTGKEDLVTAGSNPNNKYVRIQIGVLYTYVHDIILCSHCQYTNISTSSTGYGCDIINSETQGYDYLAFRLQDLQSLPKFKTWLAQQYAAGTPVTVWYVLENPATETITVPSGLSGTEEGYLNQSGTPTPTNPIYPTANTVEKWFDINHYIMGTSTDTITTLPADIYANDTTATVGLKGNMQQTGTPTPTTPIQPQETGDLETSGEKVGQYKIPISSGGVTTPVYLGEVETTRKIKKLVLTGEEINEGTGNAPYWFNLPEYGAYINQTSTWWICSHYQSVPNSASWSSYNSLISFSSTGDVESDNLKKLRIRDKSCATLSDFKSYLQQQYAAGTPVTVWYVLATETTGIVNEPIRKIGDYADTVSGVTIPVTTGANTLSVDTTVQPSEVTVNYKGWHPVADVHERDNGAWT